MWNHAPSMWAAMEKSGVKPPAVAEQQAADLFAFFYAARYFERPGDAARGKRAFSAKRCAECHAVSGGSAPGGPSAETWGSLADPIALAGKMWNHAPQMKAEFAKRKIAWPELTSQDLTDMLVYLRNLPGARAAKAEFALAPAGSPQLLKEKGCADCHKDGLQNRLKDKTLTDIAAAMWNHAPRMKESGIQLSYDEMRGILSALWADQFFAARGNADRGKSVFAAKQCGSCHGDASSGAPKLEPKPEFSPVTMVAVLWRHGPQMLASMKKKNVQWPRLTPSQVSDLTAFLAKGEATRASK
jgi:mono/diheme cytochrome c family protein